MAGHGPVSQSKGRQVIQESAGIALGHRIDGDVSPADGGEGVPGPKIGGGCAFQPSNSRAMARNAPSTRTSGFVPGNFDPPFTHRGMCSRVAVSACARAPIAIPRIDKTHRATLIVTRDFLLVI